MNILYKYCNCLGAVKILASRELKLPFISDVNDPYDGLPFYVWEDDNDGNKKKILQLFKEQGISPPNERIDELLKNRSWQEEIKAQFLKVHEQWNKENCLLCVSRTSRNPAMWAYYASIHQGIVIGIDYGTVFAAHDRSQAIQMSKVEYFKERQRTNMLDRGFGKYEKILTAKASCWEYEEEMRCVFAAKSIDAPEANLEALRAEGLALFKEFNGKNTWFLRLNPSSIKEVVFGLRTEESLKSAVKKIVRDLSSVKLYQVLESETYEFNLVELNS